MPLKRDSVKTIKDLFSNDTLLNILLEIEDTFDRLNLYAYENWFDGEIQAGPVVKRYWVKILLKYDYDKMPDPTGGLVLTKHGIRVRYKKDNEITSKEVKSEDDLNQETGKPKLIKKPVWLVEISVPRRFVDQFELENLEDDDITGDIDQISDEEKLDQNKMQGEQDIEGLPMDQNQDMPPPEQGM